MNISSFAFCKICTTLHLFIAIFELLCMWAFCASLDLYGSRRRFPTYGRNFFMCRHIPYKTTFYIFPLLILYLGIAEELCNFWLSEIDHIMLSYYWWRWRWNTPHVFAELGHSVSVKLWFALSPILTRHGESSSIHHRAFFYTSLLLASCNAQFIYPVACLDRPEVEYNYRIYFKDYKIHLHIHIRRTNKIHLP